MPKGPTSSRLATTEDLPAPDAGAMRHSRHLCEHIRVEIKRRGGCISFARYMELALYAPGMGYYSAGLRKFGATGDFVTAPEISPLFARCLARQCRQVFGVLGGGDLLEVGAGSGLMARDLLMELAAFDALPDRYLILELSADLRRRQHALLSRHVPHLMDRVQWLDRLPGEGFRGVIVANEVLDAMPVHLLRLGPSFPEEAHVGCDDGEHFVWRYKRLDSSRLRARVDDIVRLLGEETVRMGYVTEANLAAEDWTRTIAALLERGLTQIIDYGFPRHEYYHPQRHAGTLMCHYRHRAHSDPLILTGLQDITSHVDFTAIAVAAADAGLSIAGFTSQAHFLLNNGLAEIAAATEGADLQEQIALAGQIKRLTLPSEMGELFKVLALTRDLDMPLAGFESRDRRERL